MLVSATFLCESLVPLARIPCLIREGEAQLFDGKKKLDESLGMGEFLEA